MAARFRRVALSGALVAFVLAGGAYVSATEAGPDTPRWLNSLPWRSTFEGYGMYRLWERGRALETFDTPVPHASGPLAIDLWHSRKQPYDAFLKPDERRYDEMHGLGRAFEPARASGVVVRELRWSFAWDAPAALDRASALFVNLPSGDGPGFRWSEVRAIASFVRAGGGLLLIADHTDCYAHQDMLAQLSNELGFRLLPVTAADPDYGLGGRAKSWFRSTNILPHPITEGVQKTGWMNAGGIEGLTPIVQSSPTSWADVGVPGRRDSSGFTGDLEHGADESGPVTVAAAGEVGLGRVVVLADQNALGATMIGFGDNQRLFTNALGWVMRRSFTPIPPDVATLGEGCADAYGQGFRSFQVALAARGRDACEGETQAPRRVILPTAAATAVVKDVRTVRLDASIGTALPLVWLPAEAPPGVRVFAKDSQGRPAVFERDSELVVAATLLDNTALGDERADPTDPAFAQGNTAKSNILKWLFWREEEGT